METRRNWNAEDYARNSSAQQQWALDLIGRLGLGGDEALLDIGCGDGKITVQLALLLERGSVLGIDSAPAMIQLAAARFPPQDYPNLSFQLMDAASLRLEPRFDVAFSNATLHWVKDHRAVLRGVRASLKPGGRILFSMGGLGNASEIQAAFQAVMQRARWRDFFVGFQPPHFFYGPEDYRRWLPESGFQARRVELIPKDMQHPGPDGLSGWLRTTWFPYTDRLPLETRAAFLDEVLDVYLVTHPTDSTGATHVHMVRLEVEALAS